jgi:hypothetical protein
VDTKNALMKNKYAYRLEEITKFISHLETYFSSFTTATFLPQILGSSHSFDNSSHGDEKFNYYSQDSNNSSTLFPSVGNNNNNGPFTKELSPTSLPFKPISGIELNSLGSASSIDRGINILLNYLLYII